MAGLLTFEGLRAANLSRVMKIHPGGLNSWSLSDWYTAMMGEFGEAGNVIKKLNRLRDSIPSNMGRTGKPAPSKAELLAALEEELSDGAIYLDLLSAKANIELAKGVKWKFNLVSKELGVGERL